MVLARRVALTAGLLVLTGCASMSDRYYVAGRDGGGDYYLAPQPARDYYDPYAFDYFYGLHGFHGFGWGAPFGYGAWWNAWLYVPPPAPDLVIVPGQTPMAANQRPRPEPRWAAPRDPWPSSPATSAPERHERSLRPEPAPRARPRSQRGDRPIP